MDKDELLELINGLETKEEMKTFGEETFGLTFKTRDTADDMRQKLIDAANGKEPENGQEDQPETKAKPEDEEPPKEAPKELEGRRLLKHKGNGRTFIWSEKLAKNKNLYEVR